MDDKDMQEPLPSADASGPPSAPTTNSAEAGKANAAAENAPAGFWARMRGRGVTIKRRMGTTWAFAKEAWDEHNLWVEALAVKGGASAIIIGTAVAVSAVAALPFLAAAGVIAACGALIGIGILGCAAGGAKAWDSICNVYARVMGRTPKEKPKKESRSLVERLESIPVIKKLVEHPLAKKVFNSRAWKMTQKFTKSKEDSFLHSMAVGGALVTLALGSVVLATQVLVLPVVAVGTLATWAVAEVAVCFTSGIYGLYLSGQSILKKHREKKASRAADMENPLHLDMPRQQASPLLPQGATAEKPALSDAFTGKAQPGAGNDNIAAANDAQKPPDLVAVPLARKPADPRP